MLPEVHVFEFDVTEFFDLVLSVLISFELVGVFGEIDDFAHSIDCCLILRKLRETLTRIHYRKHCYPHGIVGIERTLVRQFRQLVGPPEGEGEHPELLGLSDAETHTLLDTLVPGDQLLAHIRTLLAREYVLPSQALCGHPVHARLAQQDRIIVHSHFVVCQADHHGFAHFLLHDCTQYQQWNAGQNEQHHLPAEISSKHNSEGNC